MKLTKELNCCQCKQSFQIAGASLCDHYGTRTLRCPLCGKCACDHIDKWVDAGKLVRDSSGIPMGFDWVHKDVVSD